MDNSIEKLGIIGVGKVAKAFINGLKINKYLSTDKVYVLTRSTENKEWSHNNGCKVLDSLECMMKTCKIIFLMVRPENIYEIIDNMRFLISDTHVLISVAAGIEIEKMKNHCIENVEIIRVMLNLQIEKCVGTMAVATYLNNKTLSSDIVINLMSKFGYCIHLPESQFNVFTALAGSGPAFIFGVIEALAEGAVVQGLPRKQALEIAANMTRGAALHAFENLSQYHPCQLREAVCTPGGSSIQGVKELEKAGFRAAFINAIEAAVKKNIEFSKFT